MSTLILSENIVNQTVIHFMSLVLLTSKENDFGDFFINKTR